jgi:hypothetical protein
MKVNDNSVNGNSWVSIKTVAEPSSDAVYHVRMNIFNPGETERANISVHNGTAQIQQESNGNTTRTNIPSVVKNNTIIVEIPSDLFKNNPYLILSVDATKSGAIIDQTPWRVIKIS